MSRVSVKYKLNTTKEQIRNLEQELNLKCIKEVPALRISGYDVDQKTKTQLSSSPLVEYVEEDKHMKMM